MRPRRGSIRGRRCGLGGLGGHVGGDGLADGGDGVDHRAGPGRPDLGDLLVAELAAEAGRRVGDEAEPADLHAEGVGGQRLEHGRHADEVGAEGGQHADLGRRLVARAREGGVDAGLEAAGGGDRRGQRVQVRDVDEPLVGQVVGADQRVGPGEVQVVGDGDEVAHRQAGADAAGGVGEQQAAAAEPGGRAHAVHDGVRVVALVEVDPAGEHQHAGAAHGAGEDRAGVADDVGRREAGVGHRHRGVAQPLGGGAEAGAEHDGDVEVAPQPLADQLGAEAGARPRVGGGRGGIRRRLGRGHDEDRRALPARAVTVLQMQVRPGHGARVGSTWCQPMTLAFICSYSASVMAPRSLRSARRCSSSTGLAVPAAWRMYSCAAASCALAASTGVGLHLAATGDQVDEDAEERQHDDEQDPEGLGPAVHVVAAEDVDEDADREPDPDEDEGEVDEGPEDLAHPPVRCENHGAS